MMMITEQEAATLDLGLDRVRELLHDAVMKVIGLSKNHDGLEALLSAIRDAEQANKELMQANADAIIGAQNRRMKLRKAADNNGFDCEFVAGGAVNVRCIRDDAEKLFEAEEWDAAIAWMEG